MNVLLLGSPTLDRFTDGILRQGLAARGFSAGSAFPKPKYAIIQVQRIRFGESSGSLHSSAGIPVIFEMNGSEKIEQIRTVKVPYSDAEEADSAELKHAAQQIVGLIDSGEYLPILANNRKAASKWNNQHVARLYVEFLESLESRG